MRFCLEKGKLTDVFRDFSSHYQPTSLIGVSEVRADELTDGPEMEMFITFCGVLFIPCCDFVTVNRSPCVVGLIVGTS